MRIECTTLERDKILKTLKMIEESLCPVQSPLYEISTPAGKYKVTAEQYDLIKDVVYGGDVDV
nr:MAG: hypothetical protein [Microvirus Sku115]